MSAKHKLNSAHLLGSLVIAGAFGALTQSFVVFAIALTALFVAAYHAGHIRG